MKRRDLILSAALAVLIRCAGTPAIAQQLPARKRLGLLAVGELTDGLRIFVEALRQLGWAEGQNLVIDRRFAANPEAYARSAAELVAARPDALVGVGALDVMPLLAATKVIPIIFVVVGDPVALGLVASLRRPGGNVTGIASMTPALEPKQLQLLHELLPRARRILMLRDPAKPGTDASFAADQAAAPSLGVTLVKRQVTSPADIDAAFAAASGGHADAAHVEFSGWILSHKERIIGLAAANRLPAIYGARAFAEAGGLLSYGALYVENFRRAAGLVDKVLRGARPEDLPVEEPTRFELVVNLKTARALGLSVPQVLLAQADAVIE